MNEHGAGDEESQQWQQLNLSDLLDDPSSNGSHSTVSSSINHEQIQQLNAQLLVQGLKVTRLENRIQKIEKSMATEEAMVRPKQAISLPASSLPVPMNGNGGQLPNQAQNMQQQQQNGHVGGGVQQPKTATCEAADVVVAAVVDANVEAAVPAAAASKPSEPDRRRKPPPQQFQLAGFFAFAAYVVLLVGASMAYLFF